MRFLRGIQVEELFLPCSSDVQADHLLVFNVGQFAPSGSGVYRWFIEKYCYQLNEKG
jgi:hypothetical protein